MCARLDSECRGVIQEIDQRRFARVRVKHRFDLSDIEIRRTEIGEKKNRIAHAGYTAREADAACGASTLAT